MWVPVAVWQPCELLYTCYLLTYFILCFELKLNWELDQTCDDVVISRRASLSSNDAALRVLKSTHDRHSVFQCFCFSVVCFFIHVSFRAVVSAFWAFLSSRHSSVFLLFLLYCICVEKLNIHSFIQLSLRLQGAATKYPPKDFRQYFPNDWKFFNKILHAICAFISNQNCKILFNYLYLWQSYAILSAIIFWIFTFCQKKTR